MIKKLLTTTLFVSALGYASMPTVNYDDQFDSAEIDTINENIEEDALSGLNLESLTFQEETVKTEDGQEVKKNVPVQKVEHGQEVVYINRLVNQNSEAKRNIVVKNPIPYGTKYVIGSALCNEGCTIQYSNDSGITLNGSEQATDLYNYIEFHFFQVPANSEVRMGFRAVVE